MEKLNAIKDTIEDKVEIYVLPHEYHPRILLRRLEVSEGDACKVHKIVLNVNEAEKLVSVLQETLKQIREEKQWQAERRQREAASETTSPAGAEFTQEQER